VRNPGAVRSIVYCRAERQLHRRDVMNIGYIGGIILLALLIYAVVVYA
jgi:hypothetical protein